VEYMTKQEYIKEVRKLFDTEWHFLKDELVKLTNAYIYSNSEEERDNFAQLDYGTDFERLIDDLALMRAWIEDRLNGRYPKDKKSMTRKMRRILGYTYFNA
jgi:hypothetical protein